MMSRTSKCFYASFALMLCAVGRAADRPNILFIMSDDHAEQSISAYGSEMIETPHIDRIANEGILFNYSGLRLNTAKGENNMTINDFEYIEIEDMEHSPYFYEQNMQWFPQLFEFFDTKCKF